jgi:hypothetical protein
VQRPRLPAIPRPTALQGGPAPCHYCITAEQGQTAAIHADRQGAEHCTELEVTANTEEAHC